jgi:hypothetical protein
MFYTNILFQHFLRSSFQAEREGLILWVRWNELFKDVKKGADPASETQLLVQTDSG